MKLLLVPAIFLIVAFSTVGCKSSSADGPKLFCDTACLKDTLKFAGEHSTKPFVYITPSNCKGDSIAWGYTGVAARKTKFDYPDAKLNKDFARCIFRDNVFAYILFNDCATGRGYQIKLPYDKKESFAMKTSGINNIDPKFSIADNLLAYTDRGNIYIEEVATGKKAMMTFGEKLDIDYDAIHDHIDSVNVTDARIWVKIKIGEAWKELEKKITLE